MSNVLSAYRPWLAAAILSSTVVLSACGGAEGANSMLEEKRPTPPWQEPTETEPDMDTDPGPGSQRPGDSDLGSPGSDTPTNPGGGSDSDIPPIDGGPDLPGAPPEPDDDVKPGTPPSENEPIEADGSVLLMWSPPTARENQEPLYEYELGGYEIRYRHTDQEDYEVILIEEGLAEYHEFDDLTGTFYFEIAAYDTSGLYSEFVPIQPMD